MSTTVRLDPADVRRLRPRAERLWYRVYGRSRPLYTLPPGPEVLLGKFRLTVRRHATEPVWYRVGGRREIKLEFKHPVEVTRCEMDAPHEARALGRDKPILMGGDNVVGGHAFPFPFPVRCWPPNTVTILVPTDDAMCRLR